jgi:putative membrane protein
LQIMVARPVVSAAEAKAIERRVAEFERRTGAEIVAAVEQRCDAYPEVPWRAFALGASLAALSALAGDLLRPEWTSPGSLLIQAMTILGVGALAALLSMLVPDFGRFFVRAGRMREEVRQRADVVFLANELFATSSRDAILVLVSRFERRVVVVPDRAYRDRVSTEEWGRIVETMTLPLAQGRLVEAFDTGFAAIEAMLAAKGIAGARTLRTLPDTVVQGPLPGRGEA